MSGVTLQKRVQLVNLTLNTRPLKFHKMGMSYTFLTSSEVSPLWHSLHAFAVQCYTADSLPQCLFFMSRSAAGEVTYPAADQTCWQGNTLVVLSQEPRLSHNLAWQWYSRYQKSWERKNLQERLLLTCDSTNSTPLNVLMYRNRAWDSDKRSAYAWCKGFQYVGQPSWKTQPLHLLLLLPMWLLSLEACLE